ncbi:MAG TPA: glycosyltransferase family 39 protein [Candidatus Acidoferrum sp.]|nr:glycosyltransferase family 39 protein [Candidatus Acidoferrum sp.]
MLSLQGIDEYLFTMGILIAFVGTILSIFLSRRQIGAILSNSGIRIKHVVGAIIIAAIFISAEVAIVKPTQLLFFDDVIYQAGAVSLLHSGQAWMCDYGTPTACYSGEIFHEPVATSFTLAIGFALLGAHRAIAYGAMLVVTLVAVILAFLVGTVLLNDPVAGLFSELILGLSPVVLVWAMPTTSDLPMMAYSLLAIFLLLVFIKRKTIFTFSGALLSLALVTYTKVDAILYIPVLFIIFLILNRDGKLLKMIRKNFLNTSVLVVVLIFTAAIMPEVIYSYAQLTTGSYGYQGSYITQSCLPNSPAIMANSSIGLQNLEGNLCQNVLFWFDSYKGSYVMQPIFFTLLGILGAGIMALKKGREAAALGVWFLAFFFLYASFYGGGVTFGIDWRFMLALIAPVSIFGGYAASMSYLGRWPKKKILKAARISGYVFVLVLMFYSIYSLGALLGIQPSAIQQAGDARFYENFVYNSSNFIPAQCLVFSYDPTLFILNNRTSIQMAELYPSNYSAYQERYGCLVVDWGYWCYTPNNICTYVQNNFNLQNIVNATYEPDDRTYGFYLVTGIKNSSS